MPQQQRNEGREPLLLGSTVIIPVVVELSIMARWFPENKVFLLKADGDDQESMGFSDTTLSIQDHCFGRVQHMLLWATTLSYETSGLYDARTLKEIWETVVLSTKQKVRRVNISQLGMFVQVSGRWLELSWRRLTVHPQYFVAASPFEGGRPGQRLAEVLARIKDEMVEQGDLSPDDRKYLKNSILVLEKVDRWPTNDKGDWKDGTNVAQIQLSVGGLSRVMDIVERNAAIKDVEEGEAP